MEGFREPIEAVDCFCVFVSAIFEELQSLDCFLAELYKWVTSVMCFCSHDYNTITYYPILDNKLKQFTFFGWLLTGPFLT